MEGHRRKCRVGDQQTIQALGFVSQNALQAAENKFYIDIPDDGRR
jgi:hypothetical protein